jgi:hypothetical protein
MRENLKKIEISILCVAKIFGKFEQNTKGRLE